jgi:hypothetical protein
MRTCGWRIGLALLIGAASLTCGSTKELGDTGLPESALVSALSPDDWNVFCAAFDAARRKDPVEDCHRQAFAETRNVATDGTEADVRATCQARYDACVRDIRPPARNSGICQFGPIGPDCTASVGEAEACLKEGVARRREEAAKVPDCTEVTLEQAMTLAGTASMGEAEILALPSCQNFNTKCPGLLK